MHHRIHQGLEHLEAQQAAALSCRRQRHFQQSQHVGSLELMKFIDGLVLDMLTENGRCRLADRAAFSVEEGLFNPARIVHFQFQSDLVAAERVLLAVGARRTRELPFVIRTLVMIEDVIVVQLFAHTTPHPRPSRLLRRVAFSTTALVKNSVVSLPFKPRTVRTPQSADSRRWLTDDAVTLGCSGSLAERLCQASARHNS